MQLDESNPRLFSYLVLFAAALAAPLINIAVVATTYFAQSERARLEAVVDRANIDVTRDVEQVLAGTSKVLRALATSPFLAAGDLQGFNNQARKVSEFEGGAIILADLSGRQLVNTRFPFGAPLPKQDDIRLDHLGADHGVASNLSIERDHDPHLHVAIPVNQDGVRKYVLIATIYPATLSKILNESLSSGPYFATILDRNGVIIARSSDHESFIGRPLPKLAESAATGAHGTWSGPSPEGVPIFAFWRRSASSGWLIATGVSQQALGAPLNRSLEILAAITCALILLSVTLAWWVGRKMTQAQDTLVAMAGRLNTGRILEPPSTPLFEANLIGRAIARASEDLHDRALLIDRARVELEERIETRTHELAFKTELLETTLERMDQGLVALDERGVVTICNRKARELLNLDAHDREAVLQAAQVIDALRGGDGAAAFGPAAGSAPRADGCEGVHAFDYRRADDVFIEAHSLPVARGGRICTLTDVTAAHRHAEVLRAAKDAAESASSAKTDLLATMSHEIRTPLNSIIGSADLLTAELEPGSNLDRHVQRILIAGKALTTMMDDVLDFSKVEAGAVRIRPRRFRVADLVAEIESLTQSLFAVKNLRMRIVIEPGVPDCLVGDDSRLRQVLLNFVNNAIKFTFAGGVTLTVSGALCESGSWLLRCSVADTGIGIALEKQKRLFQRYSQADESIGRRFGGTGLGLSISKRLIETMHGEVGVESMTGRGSIVWFAVALPVSDAAEDDTAAPAPDEAYGFRSRILVAEDVPVNQDIARELLEALGHFVQVVSSGEEAVAAVQKEPFDLVLMDIFMSGMDGLTATRAIRALDHPARTLPIVACTANVLPAQIADFRQAGLDGVVAKPLRRAELQSTVLRYALPPSEVREPVEASGSTPRDVGYDMRHVVALLGAERAGDAVERFDIELKALALDDPDDARELDRLARRAHVLISTASLFGLAVLAERCRELELACADRTAAAKCFHAMRPDLDVALREVARLRLETFSDNPKSRARRSRWLKIEQRLKIKDNKQKIGRAVK